MEAEDAMVTRVVSAEEMSRILRAAAAVGEVPTLRVGIPCAPSVLELAAGRFELEAGDETAHPLREV